MLEEAKKFTKEHHMIEEGSRVIAGVSGGADSVCLLLLLLELQKEMTFELRVVHVEHGIRGQESLADCEFVEKMCGRLGVECKSHYIDVPKEAKQCGRTLEETARLMRYEIFEKEAESWGGAKIAVAHNRGDDAETVRFHLIRGGGLSGMRGILPVRGNVIRPLLHTGREEILSYLEEKKQPYCVDATNRDEHYTRNCIRAQIMPRLIEMNPQAEAHIQKTADIMKEAESYIGRQTKKAAETCVSIHEDDILIRKEPFETQDPLIKKEVLKLALEQAAGAMQDITTVHLELLEQLFSSQCGRRISLPYGVQAYRIYEGIRLCRKTEAVQDSIGEVLCPKSEIEQAGTEGISCGPFTMRLLEDTAFSQEIPQKTYTKWFDYDKIKSDLSARTRKEGDYICCNEEGKTQKLKKYFVNEKVEAKERGRIPLLAEGAHILWIVGYRISTYYKISQETKRILEVRFNGGKEND